MTTLPPATTALTPADYLTRILNARVYDVALETDLEVAKNLSRRLGNKVLLKREDQQPVFSFKLRGAYNKMANLTPGQLERGVICASAGNHAQGVALGARKLGCRAIIVMPTTTPQLKIDAVAALGGEVVLAGESYSDAYQHAVVLQEKQGLTFIHPFDDAAVAAGQGTLALEMLAEQPDLDTLIVSVGGGGLIAGVATAAKTLRPSIRVVGVQTRRFPSMLNAVQGLDLPIGQSTIAEGIAVATAGAFTRQVVRNYVDTLLLVDEGDVEQAVLMLLEIEKTLVEGAGAAGLAALVRHGEQFKGQKVGLILSGGNIDPLLLASIIERGMARSGRLARIKVSARDVPGVLAKITATVAEAGANIEEVHHQRAFTLLAAQNVEIEFVLQTRNQAHVEQVLQALQAQGMEAARM